MAKLIQLSDGSENLFPRMANGLISSTDNLNDVFREGFYWCNAVGGRPQTYTFAFLINWTYGNAELQVYIPFVASGVTEIYLRSYVNSEWSAWRKIATTAV